MFDYVIVGGGVAGCILAERLTSNGKTVLIIEKRHHIGGNAYDYYDRNGILVHKYGPHIFHTASKPLFEYLSTFTEWHLYQHKVLAVVEDKLVPVPFNINSLYAVFSDQMAKKLENLLLKQYNFSQEIPILDLIQSNKDELKFLAKFIYQNIFYHYTVKQWGLRPDELDKAVTARVPVVVSRDDRYFHDSYQAMPLEGYTPMFTKMLNKKSVKIMLNTDYKEVLTREKNTFSLFGKPFNGSVIYTGPIDYFFDYSEGELPYRSLRFEFESVHEEFTQPVGTVNYPNNYEFTRITEFKHITGQKAPYTTIVYEYPENYDTSKEPYYPVPRPENKALYQKYAEEAKKIKNFHLIGRLAEYKYYNMTQVMENALELADHLEKGKK